MKLFHINRKNDVKYSSESALQENQNTKLKHKKISLMALPDGAYIADSNGKIINRKVGDDEDTAKTIISFLALSNERKGIAIIYNERINIMIPVKYIGSGRSKRINEGCGIFVKTPCPNEYIKISKLFHEAITNIQESAISFGGELKEIYEYPLKCYKHIDKMTEDSAWGGYLLYAYVIGKIEEIKIDALTSFDCFTKTHTPITIFISYKHNTVPLDFDILISSEVIRDVPDIKFSKVFLDVKSLIPITRSYDSLLSQLIERALVNNSRDGYFSKEIISMHGENIENEYINRYLNDGIISSHDLPLNIKVKFNMEIKLNDIIYYIENGDFKIETIMGSLDALPENQIIECIEQIKSIDSAIAMNVIDSYLQNGLHGDLNKKHYILLRYTHNKDIFNDVLDKCIKEYTERMICFLEEHKLWNEHKKYIKKSFENHMSNY